MPISPELHSALLKAFEEAKDGADLVIPTGSIVVKNVSRDFSVLCKRANIERYAKPLHTLRKSCLTDWAGRHAAHVVKEWAGHSSIQTTDAFYLKVSEVDYEAAANQNFGDSSQNETQLVTQLDDLEAKKEKPEILSSDFSDTYTKAGDEIRTHDVQLGKLTFYH